MRYNVGDIVVKQSATYGRQFVRIIDKTQNVNRRGRSGFNGIAVNEDGIEIRKHDPYGNKIWGYDHEVILIHKRA